MQNEWGFDNLNVLHEAVGGSSGCFCVYAMLHRCACESRFRNTCQALCNKLGGIVCPRRAPSFLGARHHIGNA
jgi:hypothetical protein